MDHLKTPTKKCSLECSPLKSPKFLKPKEILKRSISRNDNTGIKKFSPSKASTAAIRRCKLPIEHVEQIYSPLKCLQPKNSEQNMSNINNSKSPKKLTFSPLLRKLRRSPKGNQISFPVVKRSLQNITQTNNKRKFNRILDFNEDTQLSDSLSFQMKCLSENITNNNTFKIDWSLKTRLRIFINHSIPFHGTFSTLEEATGINYFVCHPTEASNSFNIDLQQHCLVWQWPVFPWMNLFPRHPELKPGSLLSSKQPPVFTISAAGVLADSLYTNFCNSFQSLFKMLKAKYCPFFYLCANNFVALFRASGVSDSFDPHVLISPTSHGFRKLLEDEGIKYQMPFHNNNSKINDDVKSESELGEDIDENDDDDDDEAIETFDWIEDNNSTQWLESLGLSEQDFPSLETASFRRRRLIAQESNGRNKTIDDQSSHGKVKSLIRINGINNLQLLVNLFAKYRKISTSTSGSFAGIPPTLVSPVAFLGATLQKININQKSTTHCKKPNNPDEQITSTTLSTLDFTGPILPHTVYGLVTLLQKFLNETCPPNTKIRSTMRIYEASSSFPLETSFLLEKNKLEHEDESMKSNKFFAVENLQSSGIDKKFLSAICTVDQHSTVPIIDFELLSNNIFYNRFALNTNNHQLNSSNKAKKCSKSVFGSIKKNNTNLQSNSLPTCK